MLINYIQTDITAKDVMGRTPHDHAVAANQKPLQDLLMKNDYLSSQNVYQPSHNTASSSSSASSSSAAVSSRAPASSSPAVSSRAPASSGASGKQHKKTGRT
jgi:hypothetical protein